MIGSTTAIMPTMAEGTEAQKETIGTSRALTVIGAAQKETTGSSPGLTVTGMKGKRMSLGAACAAEMTVTGITMLRITGSQSDADLIPLETPICVMTMRPGMAGVTGTAALTAHAQRL